MIKITNNPTNRQIAQFEDFSSKSWGEQLDQEYLANNFFDYPRIIVENIVDEEIVSELEVFLKSALFSDRIIHIAAIGGVVTHLNHRHKGYALETLASTLSHLQTLELDVAILCTEFDKLGGLYAKVGFTPVRKPYFFIDKLGEKKEGSDLMIADIGNRDAYDFLLSTEQEILVGLSDF